MYTYVCVLIDIFELHLVYCSKCSKYNPNESTKMFDKNTVRKCGILFNPNTVLEQLRYETSGRHLARSKEDCLSVYLQVMSSMSDCWSIAHLNDYCNNIFLSV